MRDVELRHIVALLEFMYAGEVNVAQAHLSGFLKTAESLQIRGLTDASREHKEIVSFENPRNYLISQILQIFMILFWTSQHLEQYMNK